MAHLLNHTAARKLARELDIRIGHDALEALNDRIREMISQGKEKAIHDKRKTILERDVRKEPDLFS
jgi:histone H3/H4